MSEKERRIKISITLKQAYSTGRRKSWNKGLHGIKTNKRGGSSWNKGKKLNYDVWNKGLNKTNDIRLMKLSKKHNGVRFSPHSEFKNGHVPWDYIDGRSKKKCPGRYGDGWSKIRYLVYMRDRFSCQHCGCKNRILDVHHKVPFLFSFDNSLSNLITLCRSCHSKEDKRLLKIGKILFTPNHLKGGNV